MIGVQEKNVKNQHVLSQIERAWGGLPELSSSSSMNIKITYLVRAFGFDRSTRVHEYQMKNKKKETVKRKNNSNFK